MKNENLNHRQENGFSPWFIRACKLVLAGIASLTVLMLLLVLSLSFPVHAEVWNGICYFLIFLALPSAIAFSLRKKKRIRLFALICVILLLPLTLWSYFGRLAHVEHVSTKYDIANYLNGDTDFDKNAATVLPTKQMLSLAQVLFFEHEDHGKNDFEMYRLSVKYDADAFAAEQQKLQENYQANTSHRFPNPITNADDDFYYDGVYYCCYTFFGETDYAFAYHTDPNAHTVSYLFFKDPINLSTMFAGPALSANKSSHVWYYSSFPQAQ